MNIEVWMRNYQVVSEGIYFIASAGFEAHKSFEIRSYDFASRAERTAQILGKVQMAGLGLAVSPDRKTFVYSLHEGTGADAASYQSALREPLLACRYVALGHSTFSLNPETRGLPTSSTILSGVARTAKAARVNASAWANSSSACAAGLKAD